MFNLEINEKLLDAAERGNVNAVLECIRAGADVNTKGSSGRWTPLGLAALYNRAEVAKVLVDAGANIRIPNGEYKQYALSIAIDYKNRETVLAILESKDISSIINIRNLYGSFPLIMAAYYNWFDVVKKMVAVGAIVNREDGGQTWTPLHWAAYHGNVECVKFLLDNGAIISIEDKNRKTALDIAIKRNNIECVRIMTEHKHKFTKN